MKETVCRCENLVKVDIQDPVDLDKSPISLEDIAEGNMPGSKCSSCGTFVWAPLPIRFEMKSKGFNVTVMPEEEKLLVYMGKSIDKNELLLGYQELFERARILRDDLQPLVIELMKYALEAKASESSNSEEIRAVYNGISEKGLTFHITGLKTDESAVIILPKSVYDNSLNSISKNKDKEPYKTLKSGNYHSIRKLDLVDSEH